MRGFTLAATLLGLTLLGSGALHGQAKDYYKDINDAMTYFKSNKSTDKSFALATLGLVGAEAKKSGNRDLAQYLAKTSSKATVQGMVSQDPAIRKAANGAIVTVNPTIAGPVVALVNGGSYEQRLQGMRDLASLGPNALPAIPALQAFLTSAKPEDKVGVVQTMATVGAKDPQVADLIATMALKDPDPAVKQAALVSLAKMPGGGSTIGVFMNTLNTERDPAQRLGAVRGLAAIAKSNPAAMQQLQRFVADPNPAIQAEAKAALQKLQPPQ